MHDEPEKKALEIVVRNYEIDVVPHAKTGKKLEWRCDEYEWKVMFNKDDHPVIEPELGAGMGQANSTHVRDDAEPKLYKYTVAVKIGDNWQHKDPELIVDA
jgi:hypothetical protein